MRATVTLKKANPGRGSLAGLDIGPNKDAEEMRKALATSTSVQRDVGPVVGEELAEGVTYKVGQVYEVPLQDFDENPFNARVFYTQTDLDETMVSMRDNGQSVAALGYVTDTGRVVLTDGQKRLRAARIGGMRTLRVEIKPKPESDLANYKESRRINVERSAQTALDDAVQWGKFIDSGLFTNQQALAKEMGVSEAFVSQVLAIRKIPNRVQQAMKERPKTCEAATAYELSQLFGSSAVGDAEAREKDAVELVYEIEEKGLTGKQVRSLVAAKLLPKKTRATSQPHAFKYGGRNGTVKVFPTKGKLELSISGLAEDTLEALKEKIEGLFQNP